MPLPATEPASPATNTLAAANEATMWGAARVAAGDAEIVGEFAAVSSKGETMLKKAAEQAERSVPLTRFFFSP